MTGPCLCGDPECPRCFNQLDPDGPRCAECGDEVDVAFDLPNRILCRICSCETCSGTGEVDNEDEIDGDDSIDADGIAAHYQKMPCPECQGER